jgi:hypothetical protein
MGTFSAPRFAGAATSQATSARATIRNERKTARLRANMVVSGSISPNELSRDLRRVAIRTLTRVSRLPFWSSRIAGSQVTIALDDGVTESGAKQRRLISRIVGREAAERRRRLRAPSCRHSVVRTRLAPSPSPSSGRSLAGDNRGSRDWLPRPPRAAIVPRAARSRGGAAMSNPAALRARRIDQRRCRNSCCAGIRCCRTRAISPGGRGLCEESARPFGLSCHVFVLAFALNKTSSFPRRVFCARALHLCFAHPIEGGRSAERRSGACEAPVLRAMTRHARRLRGALRPMTRDARLSALHRSGFWLRTRASVSGIASGIRTASSSQPGLSAWRAGSRASRGERLRAAAAGRHTSLRIQDRL